MAIDSAPDSEMIRIKALSKRYRIGARNESSDSLVGAMLSAVRQPVTNYQRIRRLKSFSDAADGDDDVIMALNDINLSISAGESVGLIGRNGSGKSTLLKVLSRITAPTCGEVTLNGRVASMLEVGTGFHPELTGRENVYLNGAILGMRRSEISAKFDDIADFSGISKFIDTPVKRYSSGMNVRLAFSVAAHLEPEILLVDEVLAVGDSSFQQRCLNKMDEISGTGRTIVFVSHQLPSVARLCSRGILLDKGSVQYDGDVVEAMRLYGESLTGAQCSRSWTDIDAPGDSVVRMYRCELTTSGKTESIYASDQPIELTIHYRVLVEGHSIMPSIHVSDAGGQGLFSAVDTDPLTHGVPRTCGDYVTTAIVPQNLLNEGQYTVSFAISTMHPQHVHLFERDALHFSVFVPQRESTSKGGFRGVLKGIFVPKLNWNTETGD